MFFMFWEEDGTISKTIKPTRSLTPKVVFLFLFDDGTWDVPGGLMELDSNYVRNKLIEFNSQHVPNGLKKLIYVWRIRLVSKLQIFIGIMDIRSYPLSTTPLISSQIDCTKVYSRKSLPILGLHAGKYRVHPNCKNNRAIP